MLPKQFLPLCWVFLSVHLVPLAKCASAPTLPIPLPAGKACVELLVVCDKEFADIFGGDYAKIVDYLTIYFWDVNTRYKSLWSLDISFRLNGVVVIQSPEDQPFIENARASDGRTEHNRILNLFGKWSYQRRSLQGNNYDMAVLMTNSKTEWGGGLAWGGRCCSVDVNSGMDWSTVVWNDRGVFDSVTVASHEMAHNLGAPHDDDPSANCPGPYGYIMSGANEDNRYFFQRCSDVAISSYIKHMILPKAGTMQDMCKAVLNDTTAYVDTADTLNCKTLQCKIMRPTDTPNAFMVWTYPITPIENIQCGNGGRCFRGNCRGESKLLKNEASGFCMNTNSRFGYVVPAQMYPCPTSNNKTPLDTLEVTDINIPNIANGKQLATPFLNDENKESGDRCFYTGTNDGDWVWTDRCSKPDNRNPWHLWNFIALDGNPNRFQLRHTVTGRCAKVISNDSNSYVTSTSCTTDTSMVWSWTDGA